MFEARFGKVADVTDGEYVVLQKRVLEQSSFLDIQIINLQNVNIQIIDCQNVNIQITDHQNDDIQIVSTKM
jgi:hypothetical protein